MKEKIDKLKKKLEVEVTRFEALKEIEELNEIDDELILKLIKAGLNERDPSANGYFLKPVLAKIPLKDIRDIIIGFYNNGSFSEQVGALKLLYHVHKDYRYFDELANKVIENKELILENREEYKERIEILMPQYEKCKNPILKFFFKWALPSVDRLRNEQPETLDDLRNEIKSSIEYSNMLKIVYPEIK